MKSSEPRFSKRSVANRVFLDHEVLLSAVSEPQESRSFNAAYVIITEVMPALNHTTVTTDYVWGNVKHNAGEIIRAVFTDNENEIFKNIDSQNYARSAFSYRGQVPGQDLIYEINLNDAHLLGCNRILVADVASYSQLVNPGVQILTPEMYLS